MTYLKAAQKVKKYLGYLLKTICCQKLSKIAQSGNTKYLPKYMHSSFYFVSGKPKWAPKLKFQKGFEEHLHPRLEHFISFLCEAFFGEKLQQQRRRKKIFQSRLHEERGKEGKESGVK